MKYLIILITVLTTSFIVYGQEYKVVCKRITGCPVINGTCPTCEIMGVSQADLDIRLEKALKRYETKLQKEIDAGYYDNKEIKPGWEWNGPTWNGLWVLRAK